MRMLILELLHLIQLSTKRLFDLPKDFSAQLRDFHSIYNSHLGGQGSPLKRGYTVPFLRSNVCP